MRLVDATNTHNPALLTLREMGFRLAILPDEEEKDTLGIWQARAEGVVFEAGDPLSLLGLVALWKHRGNAWRRSDDEDLLDALVEEAYP